MNSSKCRILYVVGRLHTGGLERQLYYLLRTVNRDLYKPGVAVWNHGEDDFHVPWVRALGVPIYSFSRGASRTSKLRAFRRLARELNPEVIHSYSFYTNFAAFWGAGATGAVALGSIRNDFTFDRKSVGPCLGSLSSRWPADQICNSHLAAENVRRSKSPFSPKRIYVIHNGLDLDRFPRFPVPKHRVTRILGVGDLLPQKRWDRLLRAASELKRRQVDCLIHIAGDGPLHEALLQQARNLGVTDSVRFLGHTAEIPALLANSTFLVHTADNEGCSNAVMEAMACGRAVVATDAGDVRFLIEEGKTGFVVDREDSANLLERIINLITDPDLCRRMGKAGRAKAEKEFGLERLAEETLNAYRSAGWRDAANAQTYENVTTFSPEHV